MLSYDGAPIVTSGTGGCPGAWGSFCMPAPGINVVDFTLWDEDVGGDDQADMLCWPEPTNPEAACEGMSQEVLHTGEYDGATLNGHVTMTFRPGC